MLALNFNVCTGWARIIRTNRPHNLPVAFMRQSAAMKICCLFIRRLLENGANSSFVNRIVDQHAPLDTLIADPQKLQGGSRN